MSSNISGTPGLVPVATSLRLVTIAQLAGLLGELQRGTPGILSATLASADGFTVASTLSDSQDADKLSAMSGSLSALAGAMTREAGHSAPERLILESGSGHIVSMNVPVPSGDLVLTVVTNESSLLGKLLWSCRNTADQVVAACAAAPQPGGGTASL